MPQEIEIKLKIDDVKTLRRALKRLGARPVGSASGRAHQWNVIFDTPDGGLAKHGQLLRIRTETPQLAGRRLKSNKKQRTLLTFKRPVSSGKAHSGSAGENHRHKVREELELEFADPVTLTRILEGLGMRGWFRYEKYRTTYRLPASSAWARGLLIELDETPIGVYVELEGPSTAIDRAAQELGFSRREYILKNYLVLYVEACRKQGKEPRDMVFAPED
ncbi:MAG TPA: class IV adenylate cyclase [Candidatus Solibacter sp.]|nr:class IV adenylate cyclase [Candidatus Solibacter sp.]